MQLFWCLLLLLPATMQAQPYKPSAVELYEQIQKLNFLGTVLYVAAHPDDENTRFISYAANYLHARTAYLSLTRGDGGQNLIGPELRELLGVIRTHELIEARKKDGGEQLFSRANDFGYSKNPDETFQIWNKNDLLHDVVLAIRKLRPDVIINRFDHRSPGTTHGHHTASAMLSIEAFERSALETAYPNQLQYLQPWQPKRLFFNTSWWFYGSKEKFEKADKSKLLQIDLGVYYKSKGLSNQEIAAKSRSCHQSQGFGTSGSRGAELEYFELIKGTPAQNLFEGIDTSWNRVVGGAEIGNAIDNILKTYDFNNPAASVDDLVRVYQKIITITDSHWRTIKAAEAAQIIAGCSGLFLEATSSVQQGCPGSKIPVQIEAINRSNVPIKLKAIHYFPDNIKNELNKELLFNSPFFEKNTILLPQDHPFTTPYWLQSPYTDGMYQVQNEQLINIPEEPASVYTIVEVLINGVPISYKRDVVFKYTDDARGETYKPFTVIPDVSLQFEQQTLVFNTSQKEKKIKVKVRSAKDQVSGTLKLTLPENWYASPDTAAFSLVKANDEQTITFTISAPKNTSEGSAGVVATVGNKTFFHESITLNYEHIPQHIILQPAKIKLVKANLKVGKEKIAYIMGAGDEVPEALQQMGYQLQLINTAAITAENLSAFDVVITGIRAYNTITALGTKQPLLLQFVENGGTLLVQYNTVDDLPDGMSPYTIKISRDRVTDENAEVKFLVPEHKIINSPNKLTSDDFKGWKQEIGLYFPSEWGTEFTPLFSAHDQGESAKNGLVLYAKYGKGSYIYTGLSFFRQLPEGIPGAFRILANLISSNQ